MSHITITAETATGTDIKTFNLDAASHARLIAWAKSLITEADPSDAMALDAWGEWIMTLTKGQILQRERQTATVDNLVIE